MIFPHHPRSRSHAMLWLAMGLVCLGAALGASAARVATNRGASIVGGRSADRTASIRRADKVWSLGSFVNDLRKPRPPKQRSERPTTGADGVEAMMTASVLEMMLRIDLYHPLPGDSAEARPRAGHYRSLLRPPSVFC